METVMAVSGILYSSGCGGGDVMETVVAGSGDSII